MLPEGNVAAKADLSREVERTAHTGGALAAASGRRQLWAKFRRLAWRDRVFLGVATGQLFVINTALRTLGLARLQRNAERVLPGPSQGVLSPPHEELQRSQRAARLIAIAARYGPYRATCLRRSLLLWWILRRRRIDCEIELGVQSQDEGKVVAHSWVRSGEVALGDGEREEDFVVLRRQASDEVQP